MSEKKNKSNDGLSREELNEELERVKDENNKKHHMSENWLTPFIITCYFICPSNIRELFEKYKERFEKSKTCPKCHVELQPDPEKKFDFRCPKCKKGFNYSDLTDSK